MKFVLAVGIVFVTTVAAWHAFRPESVQPTIGGRIVGVPSRLVVVGQSAREPVGEPVHDDQQHEQRWGRAKITWDPAHWPPNRSDWSDEPSAWELRLVAEVLDIPKGVRAELEQLDCAIPKSRYATFETSVIWGEFERSGQRDLAILCVHADKSSSTYVFWASEASRRETMPQSGNSINVVHRADVESHVDLDKPLEPEMPVEVAHDAIEIGCCECCSTIFYRHGGRWFTLPGAD